MVPLFHSIRLTHLARPGQLIRPLQILVAAAFLLALAGAGTGGPRTALSASTPTKGDSLYIGDESDSSVKQFDAQTGTYLGTFIPPGSGGLDGPRGMLHVVNLLVANQNEGLRIPGELDEYNHIEGDFLRALVSSTAPHAAFYPDGIILGPDGHTLFVADFLGGVVDLFDVRSGTFLRTLDFSQAMSASNYPTAGEFYPRGLVFGPDGLLYVSIRSLPSGVPGGILSYNLATGASAVVVSSSSATDCGTDLHRPDGLAFGPDGNLYVTSFRANPTDIDRILSFNAGTGACLDEIDLDQAGQPRAFAQYLLFGPGGYLFVPIAGNGPDTGAVRRYDVSTKSFVDFVSPGGPLVAGWGLTFGQTNPETLAYGP